MILVFKVNLISIISRNPKEILPIKGMILEAIINNTENVFRRLLKSFEIRSYSCYCVTHWSNHFMKSHSYPWFQISDGRDGPASEPDETLHKEVTWRYRKVQIRWLRVWDWKLKFLMCTSSLFKHAVVAFKIIQFKIQKIKLWDYPSSEFNSLNHATWT